MNSKSWLNCYLKELDEPAKLNNAGFGHRSCKADRQVDDRSDQVGNEVCIVHSLEVEDAFSVEQRPNRLALKAYL